jgi:hypothetical protein
MLKRLALLAVGLVLGVAIGVVCTYAVKHRTNHDWVELTKDHHGLAYSNEVFTEADIPMPDMKDPHGQAKFVDRGVGKGLELGFLVKASMDKLDASKLPEKYKKPRPWGKLTIDPTDEVTYTAHLNFTLKDKDGFTLLTTKVTRFMWNPGKRTLCGASLRTGVRAVVTSTRWVLAQRGSHLDRGARTRRTNSGMADSETRRSGCSDLD